MDTLFWRRRCNLLLRKQMKNKDFDKEIALKILSLWVRLKLCFHNDPPWGIGLGQEKVDDPIPEER